jgi:hypothetical protein
MTIPETYNEISLYKILSAAGLRADKFVDGEPEAWTLSYDLAHIGNSARDIDIKLQYILKGNANSVELENLIHEIRESIRHLLYHVQASKYLSIIEE